jgi:hypothetical protein
METYDVLEELEEDFCETEEDDFCETEEDDDTLVDELESVVERNVETDEKDVEVDEGEVDDEVDEEVEKDKRRHSILSALSHPDLANATTVDAWADAASELRSRGSRGPGVSSLRKMYTSAKRRTGIDRRGKSAG